jgi:hypothetical protein
MTNNQMLDVPQVESQDVVADEESVLLENAALREDNTDLRASALWWKTLYEDAQRRYADLERTLTTHANARVDVRFPMRTSSPARQSRAGAPAPPF